MTEREGTVLSAYTGILMCKTFAPVQEYIEEILGHPICTHEIPYMTDEIKKKSEEEFKKIIEGQI